MNLSRAFTSLLSASPKQRLLRAPVAAVHLHLFSSKASQSKPSFRKNAKPSAKQDDPKVDSIMNLKRPSEIPFQPKVANTVQLTGTVGVPVEKKTLANGRVAAVSVLIQEKYRDLPKVWIPIIFEGQLAEIAAAYLKENDTVHITGQLNGDIEPVKVNESQVNVQVLAHTLNYVVDSGPESLKHATDAGAKRDAPLIEEKEDSISYTESEIADDLSSLELWSDLLMNPNDWYDNRAGKTPGKEGTPDFKHKKTGKLLRINESTPSWAISKLEKPSFSSKNPTISPKQGTTNKTNRRNSPLWDDLVANSLNWVDHRMDKQKGLVKDKFPDFKNKVTKEALWINAAPSLVLEQLDQLEFGNGSLSRGKYFASNGAQTLYKSSTSNSNRSQTSPKDALWKDLVDNPKNWWDNRSSKLKPNHPDFKRKETGEALWIGNTTPKWVLENLPSESSNTGVPTKSFKTTLLS